MKVVNKLGLIAITMCTTISIVHAEMKSWGTASAKITVKAPAEWKIEKVQDGVMIINSKGNIDKEESTTKFKVSNLTSISSDYYLSGFGDSLGSDGKSYAVNDDDHTVKFLFIPDNDLFTLDATEKKYKSKSKLESGGSNIFEMAITDNAQIIPGSYTITLELFTPIT